ncbi:MAG: hypothetical protein RL386_1353 [Bacteroidota bacterium]
MQKKGEYGNPFKKNIQAISTGPPLVNTGICTDRCRPRPGRIFFGDMGPLPGSRNDLCHSARVVHRACRTVITAPYQHMAYHSLGLVINPCRLITDWMAGLTIIIIRYDRHHRPLKGLDVIYTPLGAPLHCPLSGGRRLKIVVFRHTDRA